MRSTGPEKLTVGVFERLAANSLARSMTAWRTAGFPSRVDVESAKMTVRIWEMLLSRLVTDAEIRSAISPWVRPAMFCSSSPVAKSCWMTWSCRSRAILPRSSSRATFWRAARAAEISMATLACPAKLAAISRSPRANRGRPASRATSSTPRPGAASGTAMTAPRCWRLPGNDRNPAPSST